MSRTQGFADELGFWDGVLKHPWSPDEEVLSMWFGRQERRFPFWVLDMVKDMPWPLVTLDVGCGPVPQLAWAESRGIMTVFHADPMWDRYRELRVELGVDQPLRGWNVAAEDLLSKVPERMFDLVYARNSIDHAADPMEVMSQIHGALRPGGRVVLDHLQYTGTHESWGGLHQWDFSLGQERRAVVNDKSYRNTQLLLRDFVNEQSWLQEVDGKWMQLRCVAQRGEE